MESLKKYTVLYVEDEKNLRDELGTFIKRRVKKIFVAENGQEGLALFKKERPDIVITDIKMPKLNGIEMTEKIRMENPLVPIIVTTALSDVESILTTVDMGIDKYLLKPIDVNALNEALMGACDKLSKLSPISESDLALDTDDLALLEKSVQKSLAKFFKDKVGKGPRKIIAKVTGPFIQIQVMESRCVYEKTLTSRPEYIKIVDYMRQSFYEAFDKSLCRLIESDIGKCVTSEIIDVDSQLDIDVLTFKIK